MRCIALVSGGKDSVAAVDVARQHGFDVVAGLVMRPAEDDAWMFHVPNIDLAPAVATCMGLEVVEAAARADPVEEVADLQAALAAARDRFGLDAVVSGALASDYQKTRIDRIGHVTGLKTFAPLWHKDPASYARDVAAAYDVRFSRVACDGLDGRWAGAPYDAEALRFLEGLRSRPHLAGEGGEFETLVLDAPFFENRIVVEESHVEATASRATWIVDRWRLE